MSNKDWDWGYITSDASTINQLFINWALYGNISELLSKRTYIKNDDKYIRVWTNVNFTSKIFTNPPPLLSKFLNDYLDVKKVAK